MSPAEQWVAALGRYTNTVLTGGTPEQRAWAWRHANEALDALLEHEQHARASRDTEELEAA